MDFSITNRELRPTTLPYLTEVAEVADTERTFAEVLYLGKYDNESNYREATQQERAEWEERVKEQEEQI